MKFKTMLSAIVCFSFLLSLTAETALFCDQSREGEKKSELFPAGDHEKALARFIAALLEKEPAVKLQKLLKVVEADPENASAPLKAFSLTAHQLPAAKVPLKELNALWARFPDNFILARHAVMLNLKFNVPFASYKKQLGSLFSLTPAQVIALPEITPRGFGAMLGIALNHAHKAQDWIFIEQQYLRWFGPVSGWEPSPAWRDRLAPLFAPVLLNVEVQAEIAGNKPLAERAKVALRRVEQQLAESEKRFRTLGDYSDVIDYQIKMRRFQQAVELARKAQKQWNKEALTLYFVTSVLTGSEEDFEKAASLLQKNAPRFDSTVSRFKMHLAGRRFRDAEQALKLIPLKQQDKEYWQLLLKSKRWADLQSKLERHLSSGAADVPETALLLLSPAEYLKSVSCYEQAKKILTPLFNNPAVANAVGYVGATLDRDLEQGEKLLRYALQAEPENAAYLDSAAWIAYKQKRYAEAEKLIQKALHYSKVQDGMSVILEHAGDIAAAQGKNSRPYYELALKYAGFDDEFVPEALKARMR